MYVPIYKLSRVHCVCMFVVWACIRVRVRVLHVSVSVCVRAGRSDVTGWMTNRTEPYRIKPNQIESNRIGPDQIRYSFLPLSFVFFFFFFTTYIIEKSQKLFAGAAR